MLSERCITPGSPARSGCPTCKKSKNIFDNKIANQIDLFAPDEIKDDDIVNIIDDWKFEERLSKEFEAVGFFISDHPLNQFKEIFDDWENIIAIHHVQQILQMQSKANQIKAKQSKSNQIK